MKNPYYYVIDSYRTLEKLIPVTKNSFLNSGLDTVGFDINIVSNLECVIGKNSGGSDDEDGGDMKQCKIYKKS